ncbi:P-loop containing nucleoside triphosphate hydrolase protein [Xylariaceae sp. FL0016]|nr:P-loop containing nucleoside triphosphate hydrolase protein [Xylariaceae sp. FL0016]
MEHFITVKMEEIMSKLAPALTRSDADPRPIVVMTCGIAGSGKSTLSKAIVLKYPSFERLSIDATLAAKRGLHSVDYPHDKYSEYQDEAEASCTARLITILSKGTKNAVLDRSFYAKEDRDQYKQLAQEMGGRCVLVYLRADSKDILHKRIAQRRRDGIDADSALDITEDTLQGYWNGFEAPAGEEEIVIDVK